MRANSKNQERIRLVNGELGHALFSPLYLPSDRPRNPPKSYGAALRPLTSHGNGCCDSRGQFHPQLGEALIEPFYLRPARSTSIASSPSS
jgi:hypothetical protein